MYMPNFLDGFDRLVAFDAETMPLARQRHTARGPSAAQGRELIE